MRNALIAAACVLLPTPARADVPSGQFEAAEGPTALAYDGNGGCGSAAERVTLDVTRAIRRVEVGGSWMDMGRGHRAIMVRQADRVGASYAPPNNQAGVGWSAMVLMEGRSFSLVVVRSQYRGDRVCSDVATSVLKLVG